MINLSGKTALVTESTDGIGFVIARQLALAGAAVTVNGRTLAKVQAAAERIRNKGESLDVRAAAADVTTAEGCARLLSAHPATDILVNNVGIAQSADFFDSDDSVWDRHWQINVMAGIRLARAYMPGMMRTGWGRVVFLTPEPASDSPATALHHNVSETADIALARGLAQRVAGTGVTVNSVLLGPAATEVAGQGRATTPDDIANVVSFLVSPMASATTGVSVRVSDSDIRGPGGWQGCDDA